MYLPMTPSLPANLYLPITMVFSKDLLEPVLLNERPCSSTCIQREGDKGGRLLLEAVHIVGPRNGHVGLCCQAPDNECMQRCQDLQKVASAATYWVPGSTTGSKLLGARIYNREQVIGCRDLQQGTSVASYWALGWLPQPMLLKKSTCALAT